MAYMHSDAPPELTEADMRNLENALTPWQEMYERERELADELGKALRRAITNIYACEDDDFAIPEAEKAIQRYEKIRREEVSK